MKFVKIINTGEMFDVSESINLRNINKILSLLSNGNKIQHLYTWKYDDSDIVCYGCCKGSAGNENKHELPPGGEKRIKGIENSDTQLLFGDIFILMRNKKLCDLDTSNYGLFYSMYFEGFDDCITSEDENLNENLNGFIVNDESSSSDELEKCPEYGSPEYGSPEEELDEEELDEDNNLY